VAGYGPRARALLPRPKDDLPDPRATNAHDFREGQCGAYLGFGKTGRVAPCFWLHFSGVSGVARALKILPRRSSGDGGRDGPPSDSSLTLTLDALVANDGLSGVCCRVEDCLPGVGASLKAGKVLGSVLSGVVFAVASHDQVMDLRGDAHGDILRTAAAATGAGKIKHEDVGC
jgi:hypothetical protein